MKSLRLQLMSLILLFSILVQGQNLVNSRQSSYETYIYKLTDKEALKINKLGSNSIDSTYLHSFVDSYPTDSIYRKKLAPGHYLKTLARKNKQDVYYLFVPNFDVKVLNNNTDLCIQVYNLNGRIINNAKVSVNACHLKFDKKTQCYTQRKSNKKGLLKVTYNANTSYFQLSRNKNNPALLRTSRKLVYGTPLVYVWRPIRYVVRLPIDGVNSIIRARPIGVISYTKYYFINLAHKFSNLFGYHYPSYKGYFVFNKPKYHQGDTVRFKTFLVDKHGRPSTKVLTATLYNGTKIFDLAEIKPYVNGAYKFSFYLHDSLDLKLDRYYNITLQDDHGRNYYNSSFRYEDYELNNVKLELRTQAENQYKGQKFAVFAKATDDNNLNLQDARVELILICNKSSQYFDDFVFVPDTLWQFKTPLKPAGETEITIPDSIMSKANLEYSVHARLLTSENKSFEQTKKVSYYYEHKSFNFKLIRDSILVTYVENGNEKVQETNLLATDNFENETAIAKNITPFKVPLNAFYADYRAQTSQTENHVNGYMFLKDEQSLLQCFTTRTKDSLLINIENPRNINFSYNIYKRNNEVLRGSGQVLDIKRATKTKQNYFISLRYLWGGKIKEETYRIPLMDKKLNIAVNQARLVYPGQKTKMEISVTDQGGKPVEGVDLTAYSLTKKFNYTAPTLAYLGKNRPGKELINNFKIEENDINTSSLSLNYEAWKTLASIDSIEYYKFLYHGNDIYKYEYSTRDNITQISPFVISEKGDVLPIHVIYLDNKPIYFSWSTNDAPYSFRVSAGTHQLVLRLSDKLITINNLMFKTGYKSILSIPVNIQQEGVKVEKMPLAFTNYEKSNLNQYIMPYRNNFGNSISYIEDHDNLQQLNKSSNTYKSKSFAGPLSGQLKLNVIGEYATDFRFEPNFEFEFSPKLIKMREMKNNDLPTAKVLMKSPIEPHFKDTVLTKSILLQQFKEYVEGKTRAKIQSQNLYYTQKEYGKLQLNLLNSNNLKELPLNIVLLKYDDANFVRVYNGDATTMQQLKPGIYKLIFFYPGSRYFVTEYIDINASRLSYKRITKPNELIRDSFSSVIKELIEAKVYSNLSKDYLNNSNLNQVHDNYMNQYPYDGAGDIIKGHVYDAESKESLIGATINIVGTNYGTICDMDGQFSLKVPINKRILRISYIGYKSKDINLNSSNDLNIALEVDHQALDEVVVVGFGVQKKRSVTGSVTSLSTALQGRVAGIDAGAGSNFWVRGVGAVDAGSAPLYVVDGMIFTGDISAVDPALIEGIEILKDAEATAIYGARGANGVILITTKGNALKTALAKNNKGANFDQAFLESASKANSLRQNFSDYAYWQPKLITDKNGKASFEVTFPDDVTNWDTFVLAMNGKKQSGQSSSSINAYKPLMAQLAVPNFLVATDTCQFIGKTLNYMPDSVIVTSSFEVNGQVLMSKKRYCSNGLVDTLAFVAPNDSLKMRYSMTKEDGYFDGEERNVPIFPVGLEETTGNFYVLDKEKTIHPNFNNEKGNVTLYADADYLDILNGEISRLIHYKYDCNEQIASKLIALLAERNIAKYKQTKFKEDTEIEKLIRLLLKNQKREGLWGWWPNSEVHYAFSLHILEALSQAKQQAFKVDINEAKMAMNYVTVLEQNRHANVDLDICMLKMLKTFNCAADYRTYIAELDTVKMKSLTTKLKIIELKQLCDIEYKIDILKSMQEQTMFGNVFYREADKDHNLLSNDIQNTLIAYRVLRQQNAADTLLPKIRRYFLEIKQKYCFWNTYESAQIIETILPDILSAKTKWEKSTLIISGSVNKTVTEFPFSLKLTASDSISISKTGFDPIYLTTYQHFWNGSPKTKSSDFVIDTHFETLSNELKAGKAVKLIVNLEVKKDAEYVMLNIPIPGGCSYETKNQSYNYNEYREYVKNETNIYCQKLRTGKYSYEINLNPRFNGTFTLNPAKVELMYFPTFNANNALKTVKVK